MIDHIGQQLGNYRMISLIGQGGFGDVYLGEHIHLQTQAAIKVHQTRLVGSNMEQFRTEAQTIARLVHPHIVRILDFGVDNGIPFLVMDYAPNGTLRQCHPRGSLVPSVAIVPYIKQIASALQYAHNHKLIHRDIKPENLLLGASNEVLLSDFGLVLMAHSTSSQTTQEMAGTVSYMAPEQINGKPRPASDQYALGIVVYEWLSGNPPFQGSFAEIATQHLMVSPPRLYGRVPGISPALEEVVFTALAKDPLQRFASVEAFATAFEQSCQAPQHTSTPIVSMPSYYSHQETIQNGLSNSAFQQTHINAPQDYAQQLIVKNPASDPSFQSTYVNIPQNYSQQSTGINTSSVQTIQLSGLSLPATPLNISNRKGTGKPRGNIARRWLVIGILLLLLLAGVSSGITFFLPGYLATQGKTVPGASPTVPDTASSAIVTLTPTSKDVKNSYTISAVTGTPDATQHQIQARLVSYTTQPQTDTATATGQGTTTSTHATGMLTFTNYYPHSSSYPAGSVYTDANGIQVVTEAQADIACCNVNANVTVHAHVVQTGTIGNIPANDINQSAEPGNHPTIVNNSNAFTGGQNSQNYTIVSQSDINGAVTKLENSLTPNAQAGLQGQIHSNERLVHPPQCAPNVTTDHQAGEKVTSVTVTITITCTGEVYDHDGALSMTTIMLGDQSSKDLGTGYALVGKIKTTDTQAILTDTTTGTIKVPITAEGVWAFTFSDVQKLNLAKLIVGTSKSNALSLLSRQQGVSNEDIHISGRGSNMLPTDPNLITIDVKNVQGL